jgi:hypothetical protein
VLGPIATVTNPSDAVVPPDPTDQAEQQQSAEKKEGSNDDSSDSDDGSNDPSLGLINTGPVQLKNDFDEPVTSGGMDTMIDNPGPGNSN